MKYKELKEKLNSMTEEQLNWPVIIFEEDAEEGNEIEYFEEQQEDIYWYEGDCMGPESVAQEWIDDNPEEELTLDSFNKIPKGTVTLHYRLSELQKFMRSNPDPS